MCSAGVHHTRAHCAPSTSAPPALPASRDPAADVAAFKESGGHVLVGTPGRLDDIMQRCATMDLRTGRRRTLQSRAIAGVRCWVCAGSGERASPKPFCSGDTGAG